MTTRPHFRLCLSLALPLGLVFLAACGDPEGEGGLESPTPAPNAGNTIDINGLYATKTQIYQEVQNAFNPNKFDPQTVITYSLVTLDHTAGATKVAYSEVDCVTDLSEVSGSTTTLDEGFYAHEAVHYEASISKAEVEGTFTLTQQLELKGANLTNPETDALPTDPDDERVYDYDGDGNPGFTIYVDGLIDGTLWAVERFRYSLDGTLYDGSISGHIDAEIEDSLMWASSDLIPLDTEVNPLDDEDMNYFQMIKVDSGYTCDKLISERATLF